MVLEPKTKYPKGEPDILRRLPAMRLSMVVQRLLDMERSKAKQVGVIFLLVREVCVGEQRGLSNGHMGVELNWSAAKQSRWVFVVGHQKSRAHVQLITA